MQHSKREQTIALAGVFQAASLVQQIANKGMVNTAVMESSLETLFRFDSDTTEGVFGNIAGVGTGLRVLSEQLAAFKSKRNETLRLLSMSSHCWYLRERSLLMHTCWTRLPTL